MKKYIQALKATLLLTTSVFLFSLAASPAQATNCDPTSDADASCGLKTAIEAKYGAGYCEDLYDWQDVGGSTLEVHHRYTDASIDSNGAGSITMEVFPTFTDTDCSVKTTSALPGNDPTYRFYTGISLAATSDITTSPGSEEFTVELAANDFEHTFTGLEFAEYQMRFDTNLYDSTGTDKYGSTNETDYFSPAWPALDAVSMDSDGTFTWDFATGPDDDDTRADIALYEVTSTGLDFTTFTSKYAPTASWEYYDWNNVSDGTYLLDGSETKKSYYDDYYDGSSMTTSGQINHNIFSEHTQKLVTIKNHVVTKISSLDDLEDDVAENITECAATAEDGEDCSTVTEDDITDSSASITKISKATRTKVTAKTTGTVSSAKAIYKNKKGKKIGTQKMKVKNGKVTASLAKKLKKKIKKLRKKGKKVTVTVRLNKDSSTDTTKKVK